MRRLYILPHSVWASDVEIGTHYTDAGEARPVRAKWVDIFHPAFGSHYLDLAQPGGMILLVTDVSHDERVEDLFHGHPDVAVLPHPVTQGNVKLKDHMASAAHKYTQEHHEALKGCPHLDVNDTDTVLDLHRKAGSVHPLMALRNRL